MNSTASDNQSETPARTAMWQKKRVHSQAEFMTNIITGYAVLHPIS